MQTHLYCKVFFFSVKEQEHLFGIKASRFRFYVLSITLRKTQIFLRKLSNKANLGIRSYNIIQYIGIIKLYICIHRNFTLYIRQILPANIKVIQWYKRDYSRSAATFSLNYCPYESYLTVSVLYAAADSYIPLNFAYFFFSFRIFFFSANDERSPRIYCLYVTA